MEHNFTWKNDGRTKVMIGCGTRPEIIRLAAVIKRCREYFDCCVVYYNQNWAGIITLSVSAMVIPTLLALSLAKTLAAALTCSSTVWSQV